MNEIKVKIKESYGRTLIYPDCATARAFTELTNTKTLSLQNIKTIRAMGYSVNITNKKIDELLKV